MIEEFMAFILRLSTIEAFLFFILLSFLNGLVMFPSSQLVSIVAGIIVYTNDLNSVLMLLVIIAANIQGNYILYLISLNYSEEIVRKFIPMKKQNLDDYFLVLEYLFKKYGNLIILIGRNLPVFHTLVSIPAGLTKIPKKIFLIYTTIGITIWMTIFFYLGAAFSENYLIVIKMVQSTFAVVILFTLIVIYYFYKKQMRKLIQTLKNK